MIVLFPGYIRQFNVDFRDMKINQLKPVFRVSDENLS